jgi:hypothetical protein
MSPLRVLEERKAHCIEGALLAAHCLSMHGRKPLIMNLKVTENDYDHVVILFREQGFWGALSKTNHGVLRYRDPIYKTVRELALLYFHEYFLTKSGKKTMRGYTKPIYLGRFGDSWMYREDDLWDIAEIIYDEPYISVIPEENQRLIRKASAFEQMVGKYS